MAAEFHQAGTHLDHTPAGDLAAGAVVQIATDFFGVANNDIAANQLGSICTGGVYKVTKKAALAISAGDTVDFDISEDEVVADADVNSDGELGMAVYAALAADTDVYVLINKRSV